MLSLDRQRENSHGLCSACVLGTRVCTGDGWLSPMLWPIVRTYCLWSGEVCFAVGHAARAAESVCHQRMGRRLQLIQTVTATLLTVPRAPVGGLEVSHVCLLTISHILSCIMKLNHVCDIFVYHVARCNWLAVIIWLLAFVYTLM